MANECTAAKSIVAFDHGWLSTKAAMAAKSTSSAVPSAGNLVTLSITVINISGSSTLDWYLDGSYDGLTWKELGTVAQSTFGYKTLAQSALDYPYVRVRVELSGTGVDALFNATLAFSCQ